MQKNPRVYGDTIRNNKSELQTKTTIKGRDENVNKTHTNKDFAKRIPKNNGPTVSLSDTGLRDDTLHAVSPNHGELTEFHLFLNAMNNDGLELKMSESGQSVFLSVKPFKIETEQEELSNTYFELVRNEVNHLREKFELNNRNYQLDDLIRLTDNSKKILSYGMTEKYADNEEKRKFIYHKQERQKVDIERKVGLDLFLRVHGRMINIISGDFESNLKRSLELKSDRLKTFDSAGDSDEIIKSKWKEIIRILDDKQEYLPNIWELAMSEYMFYHM